MVGKLLAHLRQQWIGVIALLLVLTGGTAYALDGSNTVFTDDIANGEVRNDDLAANSVGSGKIVDRQVKNADLSIGASSSNTIADGGIQGIDIANGAVTPANLAFEPWTLDGNAGTDPATDFLGTTDDVPLNLRVNDARALRLDPAIDPGGPIPSPNVIGGADNRVLEDVHSATIGGGGRQFPGNSLSANLVTDNFGTIGGGAGNEAGDDDATLTDATHATVGGGDGNRATASHATIAGGNFNEASAPEATVGGGGGNFAGGTNATIAGGGGNEASGTEATVGGGQGNVASGTEATVGGGEINIASGLEATVGGGDDNAATDFGATVGGGTSNDATVDQATVGGGIINHATGAIATVGGGQSNTASGLAATVPGGHQNTAAGDFSLVAGERAKNTDATHDGVFLFADSTNADFASAAANEFGVRASGGFRFRTSGNLSTGCNLPAGSGTFSCTSDREAKSGFAAVEPRQVLAQLAELPIRSWVYEEDPSAVRHIGPTSQAFLRAFGIGEDPRAISAVDADGIALAAIKGLDERVDVLAGRGAAPAADRGTGLSLSPPAAVAIAILALIVAAALGAAVALRWSARRAQPLAVS